MISVFLINHLDLYRMYREITLVKECLNSKKKDEVGCLK